MKKIYISILVFGLLMGTTSCVDSFLEKPDTSGTVDLDKVYSSSKNAEAALFNCYRNVLKHGWPTGWGVGHGNLGSISGERSKGYNWHGTWKICDAGLSVTGTDGSDGGADSFAQNWMYIRECFLVKENIDRVPDMSDEMKKYVKAECAGLIAYRYMGMFYRYGGVPKVTKSLVPEDDLFIKRSTLEETLEYTLELIDEAYSSLPDEWSDTYYGRLTKGAVLAMKARVLMFAARPLFNSSKPYLDFGENNSLICFGNEDPNRWKTAITANEAVLTWASSHGYSLLNTGGSKDQPNLNAFDDYGTATSTPGNKEVILAYKFDQADQNYNYLAYYYNTSAYWWKDRYDTDNIGLLSNFLANYYDKDGNELSWPKVGDAAPLPASHWLANMAKIEPRFKADYIVPGVSAANNAGDNNWSVDGWGRSIGNYVQDKSLFPNGNGFGKGCGFTTKFYYHAGSRSWFEPPLFRLAEIYLNLAEAYNEDNNPDKALDNLNMVHNRAGLPSITERNKEKLRQIIWREKAIEFAGENQRYFDVKHWKHPNIDNGIIGGQMREMQFFVDAKVSNKNKPEALISYWDSNAYICFWSPSMYLEPFPQEEVNKGIIVQNPGY